MVAALDNRAVGGHVGRHRADAGHHRRADAQRAGMPASALLPAIRSGSHVMFMLLDRRLKPLQR